jgi:hypothetical protein
MALKGYFDGSGKVDNDDRVVCLGGVAANEALWPSFEQAWGQVLADMPELGSSWHTTDARRTLGPDRFYSAASRLLGVIHDFRESDVPSPLVTYSATVPLDDYRRARREIPDLRPLEAICVDAVIGRMVVPTDDDFPILLHFDRNEEFMKHVERIWRYARRRKRVSRGWPWQVVTIKEIAGHDSHESYRLQAADLVAWAARRHQTDALGNRGKPPSGEAARAMFLAVEATISVRHVGSTYDYESIVRAYPEG